jgi:hypothetical protein
MSPWHEAHFCFPYQVKIEANERYSSMKAREDCSLLASTEVIARSQQERIDRFV